MAWIRHFTVLCVCLGIMETVASQSSDAMECNTVTDCDTKGAECVSNKCVCPSGSVMTADMSRCLSAAAEWGASCEDAVQCVSRLLVGGQCHPSSKTCTCADGFHYLGGRCWQSNGLGKKCTRSERCYSNRDIESSTCTDGVCGCAEGFYMREYSSCRRKSTAPNQECGIALDCQYPGADCVNKTCGCPEGTIFDETVKGCVKSDITTTVAPAQMGFAYLAFPSEDVVSLGNEKPYQIQPFALLEDESTTAEVRCSTSQDCKEANTECQASRCVCKRGYFSYTDAGTSKCTPELMMDCQADSDCVMRYSICRRGSGGASAPGKCSCKGGYVASEDLRRCRKMSRELGWSCLHQQQCGYFGPGAVCDKKKCRCGPDTHYVEKELYCWTSKGLGEECSRPEDCGGNAACVSGKCTCSEGQHLSGDKKECRPDSQGIGGTCAEDLDCVSKYTHCDKSKCACAAGYLSGKNASEPCVPGVGGECRTTDDCHAQRSVCHGGKCTCEEGTVSTQSGDNCLQVKSNGEECSHSVQCASSGSQCVNGVCRCEADQHYREGLCRNRTAIGDSCTSTGECYLKNGSDRTECRNSLCQCKFEYTGPGIVNCGVSSSGRRMPGLSSLYIAALVLLVMRP